MKTKFISCLLLCTISFCFLAGCAENADAPLPENGISAKAVTETESEENVSSEAGITFEAQDIEGNPLSSDIFSQSKLTMINVWATYCNPCLNEMPALRELAGEYDSGDFQILGVISDVLESGNAEGLKTAKELIGQTGAAYPHILLNASLYHGLLDGVSAVPTTFFVDQEGNLLDTVVGAMEKSAWEEKINGLLETLS